jgi:hypothetical protein
MLTVAEASQLFGALHGWLSHRGVYRCSSHAFWLVALLKLHLFDVPLHQLQQILKSDWLDENTTVDPAQRRYSSVRVPPAWQHHA